MPADYTPIGYTKKTHGSKGELKFHVEPEFLDDFRRSEVVFLRVQNKPLPFFIEKIRPGNDLIVKLEELNTINEAKPLTSTELLLRASDISEKPPPDPEVFTYDMLVGFQLIDAERGPIGTILEIQELPQHELAVVQHEGREVFIPLHEDLIEEVDPAAKKITLQLPAGLLDL